MEQERFKAVIDFACEDIVIVQDALGVKKALKRVAYNAIKETELQDCHALKSYLQDYLSTLEEGAEKKAVKEAFDTIFGQFSFGKL